MKIHGLDNYARHSSTQVLMLAYAVDNGEVHLWESKWRGSDTSIGPGGRAHQTEGSLRDALKHAEDGIPKAVASGLNLVGREKLFESLNLS